MEKCPSIPEYLDNKGPKTRFTKVGDVISIAVSNTIDDVCGGKGYLDKKNRNTLVLIKKKKPRMASFFLALITARSIDF